MLEKFLHALKINYYSKPAFNVNLYFSFLEQPCFLSLIFYNELNYLIPRPSRYFIRFPG